MEHLRADRGHRRRLRGTAHRRGPVRIGLPLDGWALAVVDSAGDPVAMGESGELVIGGVGLARYLDTAKDAAKFAALPSLAGSAPTAAAMWSAPTRPGCCSSGAPTSRSSSAGGASSWARSTPRCSRCPASGRGGGRAPHPAGNQVLVGTCG